MPRPRRSAQLGTRSVQDPPEPTRWNFPRAQSRGWGRSGRISGRLLEHALRSHLRDHAFEKQRASGAAPSSPCEGQNRGISRSSTRCSPTRRRNREQPDMGEEADRNEKNHDDDPGHIEPSTGEIRSRSWRVGIDPCSLRRTLVPSRFFPARRRATPRLFMAASFEGSIRVLVGSRQWPFPNCRRPTPPRWPLPTPRHCLEPGGVPPARPHLHPSGSGSTKSFGQTQVAVRVPRGQADSLACRGLRFVREPVPLGSVLFGRSSRQCQRS